VSAPASGPSTMAYGPDEIPRPLPKLLGLGLQHVLTMFGATVAVPLLLGPAIGLTAAELPLLVSAVMISSGIATAIQVRFGSRLPIIQGVSFAFLGPFFAIIAATGGGTETLQFIAGAIILGAIVEATIGFSTIFGRLRRFISPVVIGPVITLIGLALFQVGAPQAGGDWRLAGIVIVGAFLFALVLAPRIRFFSLFPILLAVLLGYGTAVVLSLTGVIAEGAPGHVSFAAVADAPWLRGLAIGDGGVLFPWGLPRFSLAFFLAALAGYLASTIESFGDYHAISRAAGLPEPTEQQVNRGIGTEGIGCAIAGALGGFSATSYTENIGLVALTKVASRAVVYVAAGLLVLLGLVTKVGAVIATVPAPVVGGLYCTLFGLIAAIGVANTARADLESQRNQLIIGFCLFMGLSVPAYFGGVPGLGFEPQPLVLDWAPWLGEMVTTLGSTGMAVAAILGLLLDNLIPGTDAERGLVAVDDVEGPQGELPG
jgi:solute carrier family 23 (nucleobase transporter), member 1